MLSALTWVDVVIADGTALTPAINLADRQIMAIQNAASCEGTAWGMVASHDGLTYVSVYCTIQEATGAAPVTAKWEVAKDSSAAQIIFLPDAMRIQGMPFIKLQSEDGSNAASSQTGAQTVRVYLRELDKPAD